MNTNIIENVYELSPMQQGMLFHYLYAPHAGLYLLQLSCSLQKLNLPVFERAWQRVVERHTILRTSFHWKELEKPIQVVHRSVDFAWVRHDWRDMTPDEQQQRLKDFLREDEERPFELSEAPLMRLVLIRLSEDVHEFVWTCHHLLIDGWSVAHLLKEVFSLYESFCKDLEIDLGTALPYGDYIAWLQQQDLKEAEKFWRDTLRGFHSPTPLPIGRLNGAGQEPASTYDEVKIRLTAQTTAALQALSRQQRVTLNSVVQSVWALLLAHYSGTDDVMFGVVVSGRPAELTGVEGMVGPFINTLPLRIAVNWQAEASTWIREVQVAQMEARQYEYSPLLEVQGWSEVERGVQLFESIISFINYPATAAVRESERTLKGKTTHSISKANYPLALEALPGTEMLLMMGYDCRRFEAATIERLMGHLKVMLESIADNPTQRVAEIPMLTAPERQSLLAWNDTTTEYPHERSIHSLFEEQVGRTPEAVAVSCGGTQLTYQELNERANQLARHLQRLGVQQETPVGIMLERSLEMVVGMLGILKAGGAYLPLDTQYPQERLAFMLEDAKASVLLTQEALVHRLPAQVSNVVLIDADWEVISQERGGNVPDASNGEQPAYIIYTSGSTGMPKGIVIPHRGINRLFFNTNYVTLDQTDKVAQASNSSFDAATFEIWGALLHGAQLVIISRQVSLSPPEFAVQLAEQEISTLFLTTALFNQLASQIPDAFKSLKHLLFGGENVDPVWVREVLEKGLPGRLLHLYGPAESTTFASWHEVQDLDEQATTVPIGGPVSNTQIYLLDRRMSPVPVGVPGELYIGGDGLARGYLNRPELTAEKFIPNPFSREPGARLYATGDLGRYLANGDIEFIGRRDHQVKIRGFRIELGEIAAVLSQHPQVREALVVAREESNGEKRLVGYVVAEQETTPIELRDFLKTKLPDYMVPTAWVTLEAFPLTPNGKVDQRALPAPASRLEMAESFTAPRDGLELQLQEIWEEVLSVKPISVTDYFYDLGGHSLLALRVIAQIQRRLNRELPLSALIEDGNIEKLAQLLREQTGPITRSPLVHLQPGGDAPPLFMVHPGSGQVLCYMPLAQRLGTSRPFYGLQDPRIQQASRLQTEWDFCVPLEDMATQYIEAMRSVQPEGPYLLGGWSFGSMVAFEMAQQLKRQGQHISLLLLLDGASPELARRFTKIADESELLATTAREIGLRVSAPELRSLEPEEQLRYVAALLEKQNEVLLPDKTIPWLHREVQIFKARLRVAQSYQPQIYDGKLTMFRATAIDPEDAKFMLELFDDPTLGWGELSTQPVDVHFVPGNHATIGREPNVSALAEKLNDCLNRLELIEELV
ncbi:MAG TPA: amino acid adenylation domain-containing protein [Pyrinomonadaceae bacterium]|nr:amino acid adenylation domain-containing protein [Pyrinomonadaceae bacterium]